VACPTVPPHATCGCTVQRTPCPEVSCGIACQPTVPPNATCAPGCPTHHLTCAPVCTNAPLCVTRGQLDCPFPSEIPAQCTHVVNCPLPQAQAAMGAGAQVACALDTIAASVQVACSIACPTLGGCPSPACPSAYYTCGWGCPPRTPFCPTFVGCPPRTPLCPSLVTCWTCNILCQISQNGFGCPGGGGGGEQPDPAQLLCLTGSVRPPRVTVGGCTLTDACQTWACPSWYYTCGGGCPPRTPQCPW
jgi:hypothetical protein